MINYRAMELLGGVHLGTVATRDLVSPVAAVGTRQYADPHAPQPGPRTYAHASWTAPPVELDVAFTDLIATWHARTPESSWIEVAARARAHHTGIWSRWLVLARWADHDTALRSGSVPGQADEVARVDIDILRVAAGADGWQLRVTLLWLRDEVAAGAAYPSVSYLGAMVSQAPIPPPGRANGSPPTNQRILEVAPLSQRIHSGRCAHWGGGGDAWCGPTSVAMVLGYWGRGPERDALSWVDPEYPDRQVYDAVRHCWDYSYDGAGNWSFNTAYAARFGVPGFVTRLRDLTEAEAFIDAGIPLVASLRVDPATLRGAEYASVGHLLVVIGFTDGGDVVVNDPAAADTATVRRVYHRDEFESAWRSGSGRLVYVLRPPTVPLPPRGPEPNW